MIIIIILKNCSKIHFLFESESLVLLQSYNSKNIANLLLNAVIYIQLFFRFVHFGSFYLKHLRRYTLYSKHLMVF